MLKANEELEFDMCEGWIAAGQPSRERLRQVVASGARIISLRTVEESHPYDEEAAVAEWGGKMLRIPTRGADLRRKSVREALYRVLDQELTQPGPVYFHCGTSNRIGAVWALYHAERKGLDAREAIALGREVGMTRLESVVAEVLGQHNGGPPSD